MIRFKVELLDELTADGFDDLAHLVVEMALPQRDLDRLVLPWQRQEGNLALNVQGRSQRGTDVPFVAQQPGVPRGVQRQA